MPAPKLRQEAEQLAEDIDSELIIKMSSVTRTGVTDAIEAALLARDAAQAAQGQRLRVALEQYGIHLSTCHLEEAAKYHRLTEHTSCTCGLIAALDATRESAK